MKIGWILLVTLEVGKYFTGLKFYLCEHVSYTVTDVMMKLDFPKRGRGYRTYEEAERALTLRNENKNPIKPTPKYGTQH